MEESRYKKAVEAKKTISEMEYVISEISKEKTYSKAYDAINFLSDPTRYIELMKDAERYAIDGLIEDLEARIEELTEKFEAL